MRLGLFQRCRSVFFFVCFQGVLLFFSVLLCSSCFVSLFSFLSVVHVIPVVCAVAVAFAPMPESDQRLTLTLTLTLTRGTETS